MLADLALNYTTCTCCLSMNNYIDTLLVKYNHPRPKKRHLSPYKATPITFGTTAQYTPDPDTSPLLDDPGIKHIQGIIGALLYYARVVHNILHALSEIGSKQAAATASTNEKVTQLLDYGLSQFIVKLFM